MQGKCEIFEKGLCLGCNGLEYDIDKLKNNCETYQEYIFYEHRILANGQISFDTKI